MSRTHVFGVCETSYWNAIAFLRKIFFPAARRPMTPRMGVERRSECDGCNNWYHFDLIENKKGKGPRNAAQVAASSETMHSPKRPAT